MDLAGHLQLSLGLNTGLLSDKLGQALEIASAVVIFGLIALSIEPLESRETLDTESLAKGLLGISVHLGDLDVLRGRVDTSELLVDRCEGLAVAAPRGEEFDQSGLA